MIELISHGHVSTHRGLQVIDMLLNEVNDQVSPKGDNAYLVASKITQRALDEYGYENPEEKSKVSIIIQHDFTFKVKEIAYLFILFNLIKNALYYFKGHPQARLEILVNNHIVTVRDTGPGIPAELMTDLFSPFRSVGKAGGTGLGLSYCRRTMHSFGGEITCDSVVGEYTKFTLHFPVVPQEDVLAEERLQADALRPLVKGQWVLVVDDDEPLRKHSAFMLDGLGCFVDQAGDGAQALQMLKQKTYAAVLTDLQMPDVNGYMLAQQIREGVVPAQTHIPIVAYSTEPAFVAQVKVDKVGITHFVQKPATKVELLIALRTAMLTAEKQAEQALLAKSPLEGKTVLVADDVTLNGEIVAARLKPHGVKVLLASHGQEVLDLLAQQEASGTKVDAVLMDMHMPGMDGLEATQRIRQQAAYRDLPIIALTADFTNDVMEEARQAGMNDFLTKPFKPHEMLEKLCHLLQVTKPEPAPQDHEPLMPQAPQSAVQQLLKEVQLLDEKTIGDLFRTGCEDLIPQSLRKMHGAYAAMLPLYEQQDMKGVRWHLHTMLGSSGFIGAKALHHFNRHHLYPTIHEGNWPENPNWLADLFTLLTMTCVAFEQIHEVQWEEG